MLFYAFNIKKIAYWNLCFMAGETEIGMKRMIGLTQECQQ